MGIPVVGVDGRLKGIVTNRDLRFERKRHQAHRGGNDQGNLVTAKQEVTMGAGSGYFAAFKIEKLPVGEMPRAAW